MMDYPIVIFPLSDEDGGGYRGISPDLRGCMSDGDTPEEALANTQLAILEWIDECSRLGKKVPEPNSSAKHAAEERRALLRTVADLSQIDERVDSLAERIEAVQSELRELLDNEAEWDRFAELTGVSNQKSDDNSNVNHC